MGEMVMLSEGWTSVQRCSASWQSSLLAWSFCCFEKNKIPFGKRRGLFFYLYAAQKCLLLRPSSKDNPHLCYQLLTLSLISSAPLFSLKKPPEGFTQWSNEKLSPQQVLFKARVNLLFWPQMNPVSAHPSAPTVLVHSGKRYPASDLPA